MRLKIVVRVATETYWSGTKQLTITKQRKMYVLRRKSNGNFHDLIDDIEFDIPINFDIVEDGIYQLRTCNEETDWETGCLDAYDTVLVPYKGEEAK